LRLKCFEEVGRDEGAALAMRMAEPRFQSGRYVFADSAFVSVDTAADNGLHFIGSAKAAHKKFPKAALSSSMDRFVSFIITGE